MSLIVPPLLFAFFDLTVLILLLLISYRTDLEVYAMSGSLAIMGFVLYVFALLGLLRYEYHVHRVRKERGSLMDQVFENDRHSPLFLVTAATLVWVTVVGIVDAHK
jgi:amino acid transporter